MVLTAQELSNLPEGTAKTEATLIFIDERTDKETSGRGFSYYYVPLYEYTVDGEVYHVETSEFSRNRGDFKVDIKYDVQYNPKKPDRCFIGGKKGKRVKESRFTQPT